MQDGVLVAAAQEERFTRRKHEQRLPAEAFRWCLSHAKLSVKDIDCVAYYEDPGQKLERQLVQLWPHVSQERGLELWQRMRRPTEEIRDVLGYQGPLMFADHHMSHAASAFHFSGFREAAILTADGVGEWATTTYGVGTEHEITLFEKVQFPHSVGLLYSTVTAYLGFGVNDGEYKVMGLAAHGTPRYVAQLQNVIESLPEGQFRLHSDYFNFARADWMHSALLQEQLGQGPRQPADSVTPFHADVARSVQTILEDILLEKVRYLYRRVPAEHLCMAGGVALNCVTNARIRREGPFKAMFVQPAAGDSGGALGAAALAYADACGERRQPAMLHAFWGPSYSNAEVSDALNATGTTAVRFDGDDENLIEHAGTLLLEGKVLGWFQGRMEFGPRALGARSILADPRDHGVRDRLNAIIKQRESFRPFAPAVLERAAGQHFDLDHPSPFMLEVCAVKSCIDVPAITHVDGSARVQTVDESTNPRFARLLEWFDRHTGCPMLLNTSFNLQNEPIVATPRDALVSFARSRLDALIIEDYIVRRSDLLPAFTTVCKALRPPPQAQSDRVYTFW
jgi:carbamoyltransferase